MSKKHKVNETISALKDKWENGELYLGDIMDAEIDTDAIDRHETIIDDFLVSKEYGRQWRELIHIDIEKDGIEAYLTKHPEIAEYLVEN